MNGPDSITPPDSIDDKHEGSRCCCCAMLYSLFSGGAKAKPAVHPRRTDGSAPALRTMMDAADDGGRRVEETKILLTDDGGGTSRTVYCKGFIVDSAASVHATSNRALLSGYKTLLGTKGTIRGAGGHLLKICGVGFVSTDRFTLNEVLFVPELEKNVVSVSKLAKLDYEVELGKAGCLVWDTLTRNLVGEGRLVPGGLYELNHLKVPLDRAPAQKQ